MDIIINGHLIPGGLTWLLDTTSGNISVFVSATLALIGALVTD